MVVRERSLDADAASMTRFAEKLDALGTTAGLLLQFDTAPLTARLAATAGRRTIAIGSGGSAIAATFLARCRETLWGEPTETASAMEMVVGHGDLHGAAVWVFSAGADNPDTVAALLAARARGAGTVDLVTKNPAGAGVAALPPSGALHVVPVADAKDGFLATHSLVSTLGALLVASDAASTDQVGASATTDWIEAVVRAMSPDARAGHAAAVAGLARDHSIIVAADPGAATIATLLEISIWEAAICSVQRTDLRNLGHGRHTWLHHYPRTTRLVGVVGVDSHPVWSSVVRLMPEAIATAALYVGDCGRFRNALGAVEALGLVEAMGAAVGVDPGRPGIGEFGRELYADGSLLELARALTPCIRQKRDAVAERGDPARSGDDLVAADAARVASLAEAPIGAIVLDYDGTVVATDERFSPPRREVIDELVRLHAAGVTVAIATGRGGSAGEVLRTVLPKEMHADVIMGYYNGAHIASLSVDIALAPPLPDPAVRRVADLVAAHPQVTSASRWKDSGVQLTITTEGMTDPAEFAKAIQSSPEVSGGLVRMARSAHSIDVVSADTSKVSVIEAARRRTRVDEEVVTIGDSGARGGNDNDLLSRSHGISVGTVCGRHDGSHSLFGRRISGPQALVNVLRCIVMDTAGRNRLNVAKLLIDTDKG